MSPQQEVCQALSAARVIAVRANKLFYVDITIDTSRFQDQQREWLLSCLTGYFSDENCVFHTPVVDNAEVVIDFPDEHLARQAGLERAGSLINQFIYGYYSEHGQIIEFKPSPTLLFVPRNKLNSDRH